MDWAESESTTTPWSDVEAVPEIEFAPAPSADAVHLRAVPRYAKVESTRVWNHGLWTAIGAVGLFGAVLFMRLLASDGATAAKSAEPEHVLNKPVVAAPAVAAPKPATKAAPKVAPPKPATKAAPKVAPPKLAAKSAPKMAPRQPTAKPLAKAAPAREKALARVATEHVASAPAKPMSTLRVNSLPWAEVFVDGRFVGNTPQTNLPLAAGPHKIKLVNQPLQMSKTFSLKLEPGQVLTKTVNLSP